MQNTPKLKLHKNCNIVEIFLVQAFCPLKIEITQFPNRTILMTARCQLFMHCTLEIKKKTVLANARQLPQKIGYCEVTYTMYWYMQVRSISNNELQNVIVIVICLPTEHLGILKN